MGISKDKGTVQRYSKKVGINLARREYNKKSAVIFLVGLVLIACMGAAIGKFGVIDQYARLSEAEAEYAKVHEQNTSLSQQIAEYSKVQLEYRTYSTEWMDDSYVDRKDILDLVEAELLPCGNVSSITVNGNTALVTISAMTLEEVSAMVTSISNQPIVSSISLNTAHTAGQSGADVTCTLTIGLNPMPKEQAEDER